MSAGPAARRLLFEGGPPLRLQAWLGLMKPERPRLLQRAGLVIAVAWLPLLLITAARGELLQAGGGGGFLADFACHARYLVAAPLLVLAEGFCLPRLSQIGWEFISSGLVAEADYPRHQAAVASTRRLLNSTGVEVLTVLLAYALVGALLLNHPLAQLAPWHGAIVDGHYRLAAAGWWIALVSLPLLVVLELGWVWRLCLWTRFLWLMSRMPLRLIAAHPDQAGGVKFVDYSLRAFAPLGLAIGVLSAGPILNLIEHQGASPAHFKMTIFATVVAVLAVFVLPLLVFAPRLAAERRRGSFAYGALAVAMGIAFEKRWFGSGKALDAGALAASDFSATTDLYSITANANGMQVLPLDLKDLGLLGLAALLPFAPVALLAVPLNVILDRLAGLFL